MTNFISGEPSQQIDYSWLLLGIISAAFSGIAYTAIRKLKGTDTPINIVIYFPMISIPVMAIWSCFEFTMPRGIEWLFLLVIGIFTQIAQVMLTKALHEGSTAFVKCFGQHDLGDLCENSDNKKEKPFDPSRHCKLKTAPDRHDRNGDHREVDDYVDRGVSSFKFSDRCIGNSGKGC